MSDRVEVSGLREFNRALRKMDTDLPKSLRLALNAASNIVVDNAKPRIPKKSGKAKASVKARSTRVAARVVGGGNRAPYYPWLDFGGKIRSGVRPYISPHGRYIYKAYFSTQSEFQDMLQESIVDLAKNAGLAVSSGE